jgi:glycosyltransferase involved in cell wall biosynthesis
MIVGVDVREWHGDRRTGIGRFLEEFLRVAHTARPRDRFLLIGNADTRTRVRGENVTFTCLRERWTPWWDQVTLPRSLRRSGANVLYSPYIKAPLAGRVPAVNTIHDLTFFIRADYNRRRVDLLLNAPFRLFCHAVVKRAAAIIVDSAASGRDVRRLLCADPAKVRVVPLATSPAFRSDGDPAIDAAALARFGLAPGYVLYVGGFWPHKNLPQAIRAHTALPEALRQRHPLILAGGPLSGAVDRLLKEPASAAAIRYLGPIPDVDLPALYRGAALFVFPSHYEGFGLPVLEAMASGTPVLCSTAAALLELTGGAAHHVSSEDGPGWQQALQALLEDPTRRDSLAASGRVRAAAFSPERMASKILAILDEVAAWHR